jgi:arylformamidase
MRIIDISVTIQPGMVTWDNNETSLETEWLSRISNGESCNLSRVTIGSHCGTHLDAPLHFIDGGGSVDELNLNDLIGICRVVDLPAEKIDDITGQDCGALGIDHGTKRILFKTSNSHRKLMRDTKFHNEFVALAPSGAQWLVDHGVRTVGVDYLSVGSPSGGAIAETHRILLGAGLVCLEGLLLEDVAPGTYQLIALPLKIKGAEGCPIRAVLLED